MNFDVPTGGMQSLFLFYIKAQASVIGEYGGREDTVRLYRWAREYCAKHSSLTMPEGEVFGVYYPFDDEDMEAYGLSAEERAGLNLGVY